jgi:hypothetical protein
MGVTRTHGIPGLPGNNNFKVMYHGRHQAGLQGRAHRQHGDQQPAARRPWPLPCRSASASRAARAAPSGPRSTPRFPRPKPPASSSCAPRRMSRASSTTRRARSRASSTSTRTARSSARRRASSAWPATRSKRRACCCCRPPTCSRTAWPTALGHVGRHYMRHMTGSVYAAFKSPVHMYRGTTMAGIVRDEAGHNPARGFAGGYELETLALGIPFMAAFLNPAPGARTSPGGWTATPSWPACGWWARTCRARPTA